MLSTTSPWLLLFCDPSSEMSRGDGSNGGSQLIFLIHKLCYNELLTSVFLLVLKGEQHEFLLVSLNDAAF